MPPVRISVQLQPQHADYEQIRDAVTRTEDLGVDAIYNWDHFFPLFGGNPDRTAGKHYECWTMLGAWAEQTERVDIGALVSCNSYRNPQLLADMARTIDNMSDGRLVFGIGAGWFEKDYDEYGYDFGTPGSRLRALSDAMPLIVDRLGRLDPPPRRRIPILIGGGGEKVTLRIAAQYADVWHGYGEFDTLKHKLGVLDNWCAEVGRDPGEITRSTGFSASKISEADAYHGLGFTEFTFGLNGPDYDLSQIGPWLAWRDQVNGAG